MPKSEVSGHIELSGDIIRYASSTYPDWTISVDAIHVVGEATNQNGPYADDYFICFATSREMWYEASFDSEGRDKFLAALGASLGVTLQLKLTSITDFNSRILWPIELVGKPMFKYDNVPTKTIIGRLLGSTQVTQRYSEHVLAAFGK
jgi:hypothetical protein